MKKFPFPSSIIVWMAVLLFISCYPDKVKNPSDLDIIATDYDPAYAFRAQQTYFMPDQVLEITADTTQSNNSSIDPGLEEFILEKVSANFNARGYTRVDTILQQREPDFLVVVSFANKNVSGTTYVPAYLGPYGGYWGGYYGWGGGWGYSTPYYAPVNYSYSTGTLLIEILDPKRVDQTNKQIPVVWRSIFNGMLSDVEDFTNRIDKNISQAFIQSPYIGK